MMIGYALSVLRSVGAWCFKWGPAALLPLLAVVITADAVLRYVFSAPLAWAGETSGFLLLMMFFFALPYSGSANFHIRMSVFNDHFTGRGKAAVEVISALGALVFGGLLTYQSLLSIFHQIRMTDVSMVVEIPYWPFSVIMFLSAALFCVAVLTRAIEVVRAQLGGE